MKAVIPPPVVLLICGLLMWLIKRWIPSFYLTFPNSNILFWIVLLAGLLVLASGFSHMIRHKTTTRPFRKSLGEATTIVTKGIFRYTRNPIYLGMAILLVAWVIFLENWLAVTGVVVFIAFITEYQIKPEEEALEKIFGDEYVRYRKAVRRWI